MRDLRSAMASCEGSLVLLSPYCHQWGILSHLLLGVDRGRLLMYSPWPHSKASWSLWLFVQDALHSQMLSAACCYSYDCPRMDGDFMNLPDGSAWTPYLTTHSPKPCYEPGCLLSSTQGSEVQAFSVVKLLTYLEVHYPKFIPLKEAPIKDRENSKILLLYQVLFLVQK